MTTAEHTATVARASSKWQRRRLLLRVLWFCALACVLAASLVPADSAAKRAMDALPVSDKAGHFAAYFLLALLPAVTERRRPALLNAAAVAALGFALECWQSRFGQRSFDAGDVGANVAGVLSALATVKAQPRLKLTRRKGGVTSC